MAGERPTTLRIGGLDYKVRFDCDRALMEESNYGHTSPSKLEIRIDSGGSMQRQRETLLHEAIHAANFMLPPDDQADERQVKAIALGLFQAIRSSPEFWAFVGDEADDHQV